MMNTHQTLARVLKAPSLHCKASNWLDANKTDDKDQQIGIVGYEIPFNRHFYQYQPPRNLVDIDADLDKVSAEIMSLLQEVRS